MPRLPALPILSQLIPSGIDYGTILLVEFEPDSLWYETSLAIAAYALREHVRTDYHTWIQAPDKIREKLAKLGLDVQKLEQEDVLRVIDSYSTQTGAVVQDKSGKGRVPFQSISLKLTDMSIAAGQEYKGHSDADRRRLHFDDNTSITCQYNDEKTFIEYYRARFVPRWRADELVIFNSVMVGVHSAALYKHLESVSDGILDFRSEDAGGHVEQFARVRMMRGEALDSRWRRLKLMAKGEVTLAD